MIDNLNRFSGPLKTLTEKWLVHSIGRGDIARILEPLLLTLLDPSTSRVSVLHCKIDLCDIIETPTVSSMDDRTSVSRVHKVYAIAAANGEVIHHVSGGGSDFDRGWADNQVIFFPSQHCNLVDLHNHLIINFPLGTTESQWWPNLFNF